LYYYLLLPLPGKTEMEVGDNLTARCIMLQGTSSHVGKSLLAAGLCRLLYREGFKVAPFKSQNMALNSYVTGDGGEIGRAQGVQAEAAGVQAAVEMNPILLKPKEDMVAQVIVMGRPYADMSAREYRESFTPEGLEISRKALHKLRGEHDVVVIEGAGSPAEINLKDRDIVNMNIASLAEAPVLLVADIDRGGVFASLVGTLELLTPQEREMVAGFIINKFRGDVSLLTPALDFLENRTGLPVLGVVPFIRNLGIEEEDSVALYSRDGRGREKEEDSGAGALLDIAVIKLPRISNYTDFDPLDAEKDVRLRYVERKEELASPHSPDAVIIPGTKNTTADLAYLHSEGLAGEIMRLHARGGSVVGICGGYQMLGRRLYDPQGTESSALVESKGLGLLPISTSFNPRKLTRQVRARVSLHRSWGSLAGLELQGYEIRHGGSEVDGDIPSIAVLPEQEGAAAEIIGLASPDGTVFGAYLHNIFHNDLFRRRWLDSLRFRRGLEPLEGREDALQVGRAREESYDRLAFILGQHLDLERLYRIIGLESPPAGWFRSRLAAEGKGG